MYSDHEKHMCKEKWCDNIAKAKLFVMSQYHLHIVPHTISHF